MTAFELIKLLIPQFYMDVKEMMGVYEADGKLLDKLCEDVETVKLNQFVFSSDEAVIERLERFFRFSVNQNKSLMDRKHHIVSHLTGLGKISKDKIVETIRQFTDAGSDMTLDMFNENNDQALFVTLDRGIKEDVYWNQLVKTLADRLPAHLAFVCSLSYSNGSFAADGYAYEDMSQYTHEELSTFTIPIEEVIFNELYKKS